ncbi:hypothetical protein JMJ35_007011 [Cladonia borealis]|uniref:Uncharacterized protein n=1 Tax=Cladonia borealis TaxID=184061 RepID=A0AA39QYC6_9LECA|nr:hypothetical protein JMJ35_007011 [Cladonia borealis]
MPSALSTYAYPANGSPPGPSKPPGTLSVSGMKADQPSTTDEVNVQVYLELWQQVLSNTMDLPDEDDEALVAGIVTQSDSRTTLLNHLRDLKIFEVNSSSHNMFSALQAAIDKQSWPFIPHIRETPLVQSEKFPHQPDVLLGCKIRSYALDQRKGTLKLLTLRGIVTIRILSDSVGSIGIDPNLQHTLNCISSGGHQKIIHEASFARRKGNGSNASQFLVFGLLYGSMSEMGFIFCKDPGEPRSGPTGHVTITYPSSMMDDTLSRKEYYKESKISESSDGFATSDSVQEPAIAKRFCCPYCSNNYASMSSLISHFLKSLKGIIPDLDKHPGEEIREFIRNSRKACFRSRPVD